MEKELTLRPYDSDVADQVFSCLFCHVGSNELGLETIPAASYQLVVSALEAMLWETNSTERQTLREAIGIVSALRDRQKLREYMSFRQKFGGD